MFIQLRNWALGEILLNTSPFTSEYRSPTNNLICLCIFQWKLILQPCIERFLFWHLRFMAVWILGKECSSISKVCMKMNPVCPLCCSSIDCFIVRSAVLQPAPQLQQTETVRCLAFLLCLFRNVVLLCLRRTRISPRLNRHVCHRSLSGLIKQIAGVSAFLPSSCPCLLFYKWLFLTLSQRLVSILSNTVFFLEHSWGVQQLRILEAPHSTASSFIWSVRRGLLYMCSISLGESVGVWDSTEDTMKARVQLRHTPSHPCQCL